MNTLIEIHNNDTNESGYYDIWFNVNGQKRKIRLSENETDSLLNLTQKEDFFIGAKYRFKISEYDFKQLISKTN